MQLSLSRLTRRHGQALVEKVTGGKALPEEVLDQILAKTDGVPLFVEELTKTVLESGFLTDAGDRYELAGPLRPLAIPSSLHDSLMARLDNLAPIKDVAQIGAVIGREFSSELLATVSTLTEDKLSVALDQLVASELIFRRGTPPDATYTFKHALVQDAAYASLLRHRRQELHAGIARALEREFSLLVEASPETLARHFTEASLIEQAIPYWLAAGHKAAGRSANVEAIEAFRKGLELVEKLPDDTERNKTELAFQLALGPVLMAAKGLVGADVGGAYNRARELCELVGGDDKLWSVLFGLSRFHLMRGEVPTAKERAHELTSLAEKDDRFSIPASWAEGAALFWAGEPHLAQPYFAQVAEAYDPERHHALASQCAADPGVVCNSFLAWILWMRGCPEQALGTADRAITLARSLSHQHSIVWATSFSARLRFFCRDLPVALSQAVAAIELADEMGFPHFIDEARAVRGWTLVQGGNGTEGAELIHQALDGMLRRGQRVMQHWCLGGLAQASRVSGDPSAALDLTSEALEVIDQTGLRWWESELHRLQGELLAAKQMAAAQVSFDEAIEVARRQDAKSFELRAATSLARLWAEQGERQKAHDLLAPTYAWFTEGFDTADLKDAKALLDQLAP